LHLKLLSEAPGKSGNAFQIVAAVTEKHCPMQLLQCSTIEDFEWSEADEVSRPSAEERYIAGQRLQPDTVRVVGICLHTGTQLVVKLGTL